MPLARDEDQAAPHIIDVEVFSVIRRERRLDHIAAEQAVAELEAWPGERFGHRLLLARAWELRDTVRGVGRHVCGARRGAERGAGHK